MYRGPERRTYKRIRKRFMMNFKKRPEHGPALNSGPWHLVTLQNLGAGGALFNYDQKVDAGETIEMKITFPMAKDPVVCKGEVVRVDETAVPLVKRISVEFTHIGQEAKDLVDSAAEGIYSTQPGRIEP